MDGVQTIVSAIFAEKEGLSVNILCVAINKHVHKILVCFALPVFKLVTKTITIPMHVQSKKIDGMKFIIL